MNLKKYIPTDLISLSVFALGLCYLAFIWSFNYFPTMDGPSHISNGKTISDLILGNCPKNQEVYEFSKTIVPNWISHLISAVLSNLLAPELISKLMLSLIIFTHILGFYRLTSVISPQNRFLTLFGCIFTLSWPLYSGGFNYLIGMSIFLFAAAYWLSSFPNKKIKKHVIFLYFLLLYFSHIFALAAFCFLLFFTIIWRLIFHKEYHHIKLCITLLILLCPFIILFAHYYNMPKMVLASFVSVNYNIVGLALIQTIFAFGKTDLFITYLLSFIYFDFLFIAIYKVYREKIPSAKIYVLGIFLLTTISCFAPVSFSGGWVIIPRLQYLLIIISIMMFASLQYSKVIKNILIVVFFIINIALIVGKYPYTQQLDNRLSEIMLETDKIPDNSSFIVISISPSYYDLNSDIQNYRIMVPDITGFYTFNRCVTNLANFHSSEKNTFPIKYKDKYTPYETMGKFRNQYAENIVPPELDLRKYKEITGFIPDYLIVWGKPNLIPENKSLNTAKLYSNFTNEINRYYTISYVNKSETVSIYKKK